MKLKRFREWSRGWQVALVLVGIGVLATSYYLRDVIQANWIHNSVYETAKLEGAIVTAQDLRDRYGAKDKENAAPILTAAMADWDKLPKSLAKQVQPAFEDSIYSTPKPRTPEELALADAAVIQAEARISRLAGTLTKEKCDFKYDWNQDAMVLFPQFTYCKNFVKVLSARARTLARQGKVAEAIERWNLALHISRLCGEAPILLAGLARISGESIALRSMSLAIAESRDNQALRAELRTLLKDGLTPISPERYLDGELFFYNHATTLTGFEDVSDAILESPLGKHARIPGAIRAWRTRMFEYCILQKRRFRAIGGDPVRALGVAWDMQLEGREGVSYTLGNLFEPTLDEAFSAFVRPTAHHSALLSALDVLDARQKLGHWPETLPVSRRDQFGAKPLRYRRNGNGVRIWSVGADYEDSNGQTKAENENSDDIVVRL